MSLAFLAWAVFTPSSTPPTQVQELESQLKSDVAPLLAKYCGRCHGGKDPAGGLSLVKVSALKTVTDDPGRWGRVAFNVKSHTMPPSGLMPSDAERQKIVTWVESVLATDCKLADPGRVTIRRLNRREYDNTVRDLTGLNLHLSDDFPSDDVGMGFDNMGDVLSVSPLLMDKYLSAAEKVATAWIKVPRGFDLALDPERAERGQGSNIGSDGEIVFFSNDTAVCQLQVPEGGECLAKVTAWGQRAGNELPRLRVTWDRTPVGAVEVKATAQHPTVFQFPIDATPGHHELAVSFVNDFYDPQNPDPNSRDRNLFVTRIELTKPAAQPPLPNGPITLLPKSDSDLETPRSILAGFAARAFRRPVRPDETQRLVALYTATRKRGETFERAMQVCVAATLASPNFLFRVEPTEGAALDGYELATRLSYFLWGSMPDSQLFSDAASGKLADPGVLAAEVDRMLQSAKGRSLAEDFAEQAFQLRKIEVASPDPRLYATFDASLRNDMLHEVDSLFMDVVNEDKSVLTLIDTDTSFLNHRLADFYGIPNVVGDQFRAVKMPDRRRGGLLGTAAFLIVTSNPNRTSPVKRGKWILENILGTPPPPPPPNVPILMDDQAIKPSLPIKERMAQHRKDPQCATCHAPMDGLGFALENYDPVGRWRTSDGQFPVDATGELPGGQKVDGPVDLKRILLDRKDDFVRSLAEKMLTYATGRGLRPQDTCHVDAILKTVKKDGYRMRTLIKAVVLSDPFRKRSL